MKQKYHSFSGRLTRRVVAVMLLTLTVLFGLLLLFAVVGMTVMAKDHYQDMLELTNEKVERMLTAVEVSSVNNVDAIQLNLSRPEDVVEALKKELRLNPHIIGCGVAFAPGYFPAKGQWYEPYAVRLEGGAIETRQIGGDQHDYFQKEWYRKPTESGLGYWSDPYYDEAGAKATLCTYAMPILDKKGKIVGVFGADVSLEWLTRQMKDIDTRINQGTAVVNDEGRAFSFILGRNGNYIVHPDPSRMLLENYFDQKTQAPLDTAYVRVGRDMLAGKRGNGTAVFNGQESYVFYAPLSRAGWSMAIVVPRETAMIPGLAIATIMLMFIVFGLLAMILVCRSSIRKATHPLRALAVSADEVAKGHFDTRLPRITERDEIRMLRDSFANMQQSLSQYIEKLKDSTARQASLDSELGIAKSIQMFMLPNSDSAPALRPDLDVYGMLRAAKAVGGDLYDFYIRDERLFFCIGDVSGKGVPASLVMAVTSAQLRTLSASIDRPDLIVAELNNMMATRNDSMMFVTLFVGVLDLATGRLQYCNAGHDAPILLRKGKAEYIPVEPNISVGIQPDVTFSMQEMVLEKGASLFLYTDGLTEATDSQAVLFGEERVFTSLQQVPGTSCEDLVHGMVDSVEQFVGEAEQSDDLTMLAIARR
ncbi:MAG: SpoIIE family protein phosphatase [Bacteroidales bacterium]|nr:SpoIIE family protein phosphatase [Bacteroidales bacterium]